MTKNIALLVLSFICIILFVYTLLQKPQVIHFTHGKKEGTVQKGNKMKNRLIEELLPNEIINVAKNNSIVFVPISPRFEWHSYHLPIGTDGIIAEESSKILAEIFGGLYFRTLPIALDEDRDEKFKEKNGLDLKEDVFGMNFPNLPIESEYNTKEDMKKALDSRLKALKGSGFKKVVLVNHHGGKGQFQTVSEIANHWNSNDFKVMSLMPLQHGKLGLREKGHPDFLHFQVGGHAGILETHQLMAFRPDLVDLSQIPEGELSAKEMGILHGRPVIEEIFNPKHVNLSLAQEWKKKVIEGCTEAIQKFMEQ